MSFVTECAGIPLCGVSLVMSLMIEKWNLCRFVIVLSVLFFLRVFGVVHLSVEGSILSVLRLCVVEGPTVSMTECTV